MNHFDLEGRVAVVTGGARGIGLAIAKKAVEAQGGQIELTQSPAGGARFRLRFVRPRLFILLALLPCSLL